MTASATRPSIVIAAGVAGLVASTVLFAAVVAQPIRGRHSRAAGAAEASAVRRQRADRTVAEVQLLDRELRHVRADLGAARLHVRSVAELNRTLAAVVDTAAACGVTVQTIEPGSATPAGPYAVVPIRLVGHSNYVGCGRLLHAVVERMPDVGVRSVDLGGGGRCAIELVWLAVPAEATRPPTAPTAVAAVGTD